MKDLFSPGVRSSPRDASQLLTELFRCPNDVADFELKGDLSQNNGFFRFGPNTVCYGQCSSGAPAKSAAAPLHDALKHLVTNSSSVQTPFDPVQVVDCLRHERYVDNSTNIDKAFRSFYYAARPAMGPGVRKYIQRLYFRWRQKSPFSGWPVDTTVEEILERLLVCAMKSRNVTRLPFVWFWPDGAASCTTISHDVETNAGLQFCPQLMDLDDSFGVKSSFPLVPEERYTVSKSVLERIRGRGFEINVHDLNHDGYLFSDNERFLRRARRINQYARQFGRPGSAQQRCIEMSTGSMLSISPTTCRFPTSRI